MNKHYRSFIAVAALMLAPVLVSGGNSWAQSAADLERKVMAAKTPADHEAIAALYDKDAEAALKDAQKHRNLAKFYKSHPVGRGEGSHGLASHCENIAKNFEESAKALKDLANTHREAAARN